MNIGLEDTLSFYAPAEFAAGFKKTMASATSGATPIA